jgi:hypothetical protein
VVFDERLYGEIGPPWGKPVEVLFGNSVKRIEPADDRTQRKRVPGQAVFRLRRITVDDALIGARIRGPVP